MARRNKSGDRELTKSISEADELRRLNKLLALLLVKGEAQSEKIRVLTSVGFSSNEVATLLDTTANAILIATHRLRKSKN